MNSSEVGAGRLVDQPALDLAHQLNLRPQGPLGELAPQLVDPRRVAEQELGQRPLRPAPLLVHQLDHPHAAAQARDHGGRRGKDRMPVVLESVRVEDLLLSVFSVPAVCPPVMFFRMEDER